MKNDNIESKIEHWYESKIVFMISILTPVVVIMVFISNMRTDIALTRQDVGEIKNLLKEHISGKTVAQDDTDKELTNRITIVETKLGIKGMKTQ